MGEFWTLLGIHSLFVTVYLFFGQHMGGSANPWHYLLIIRNDRNKVFFAITKKGILKPKDILTASLPDKQTYWVKLGKILSTYCIAVIQIF